MVEAVGKIALTLDIELPTVTVRRILPTVHAILATVGTIIGHGGGILPTVGAIIATVVTIMATVGVIIATVGRILRAFCPAGVRARLDFGKACSEFGTQELRNGAPISKSACGLFAKDRADLEIGAPGSRVDAAFFLSS